MYVCVSNTILHGYICKCWPFSTIDNDKLMWYSLSEEINKKNPPKYFPGTLHAIPDDQHSNSQINQQRCYFITLRTVCTPMIRNWFCAQSVTWASIMNSRSTCCPLSSCYDGLAFHSMSSSQLRVSDLLTKPPPNVCMPFIYLAPYYDIFSLKYMLFHTYYVGRFSRKYSINSMEDPLQLHYIPFKNTHWSTDKRQHALSTKMPCIMRAWKWSV